MLSENFHQANPLVEKEFCYYICSVSILFNYELEF